MSPPVAGEMRRTQLPFGVERLKLPCLFASAALLLAAPSLAQPLLTAEQRTQIALERIRRIDPALGSVLAIDPTALEQARTGVATRLS